MKSKKNLILLLLLFSFSAMCFGQEIGLKNIRQQIRPMVDSIWRLEKDFDYKWPVILIVRDSDNVSVENENFIPEQKFALYRLAYLSPHSPRLYILVRNDKGYIVNMKNSLPVIISDVVSVAEKFKLTDSELITAINTVIKGYNYNQSNRGGVRIEKPFFER